MVEIRICPNCHSEVEDHFDLCWNCNYSFSGDEIVVIEDCVEEYEEINTSKPYWYKIIVILSCIPICSTPLFFLLSILMVLDSSLTYSESVIFWGINAIPILFASMLYVSSKLFGKHKILSVVLASLPFTAFVLFCFYFEMYW